MNRCFVVVGDAPATGGEVLPMAYHPPATINERLQALIGGRVYCAACNSVGFIAKAGGPYRSKVQGLEFALEGDVVVCQCPVPPPLVASFQRFCRCDDRAGGEGVFSPAVMGEGWYVADEKALVSAKKAVDGFVKHPPEADETGNICPGMTDDAFKALMLRHRDRAIYLINRKLTQLAEWDKVARGDVYDWFGRDDEEIRGFLQKGLRRTVEALQALTEGSFAKYSGEFARRISCAVDNDPRVSAGVCKSDLENRVIGIARGFCILRPASGRQDSQLSTLIHEVTHFRDVLDTDDPVYGLGSSREAAAAGGKMMQKNADSITGYIVWDTHYGV